MMPQTLSVSVEMDAGAFHKFAVFDFLHHKKAWKRPLIFAAILLFFAAVCLTQVGKREGAALLAAVLFVIAFGLPAAWFWTFFHNLKNQIKKMGLPRPFYRLAFSDAELAVWMAGELDKTDPSRRYDWSGIYRAYRTSDAIYLYVQQDQAYFINSSLDAVWGFLQSHLPAGSLQNIA